jgi:hypothetical protein
VVRLPWRRSLLNARLIRKLEHIPFVAYSGATVTDVTELAGAPWVAKPSPGKALLDALMQAITLWGQAA